MGSGLSIELLNLEQIAEMVLAPRPTVIRGSVIFMYSPRNEIACSESLCLSQFHRSTTGSRHLLLPATTSFPFQIDLPFS